MTSTASQTEHAAATKPRQVYQLFIKATPERVWEAITSDEFTARYFYDSLVESSLEPGTPFRYHNADRSGLLLDGEVIECDPPRRLVHSFRMVYRPELAAEPASRVTWELEPAPGGVCKLTVVHDGFDSETETFRETAGGWMWILSNMKTLLETGEAMPSA